jgi:hypothetical protein
VAETHLRAAGRKAICTLTFRFKWFSGRKLRSDTELGFMLGNYLADSLELTLKNYIFGGYYHGRYWWQDFANHRFLAYAERAAHQGRHDHNDASAQRIQRRPRI